MTEAKIMAPSFETLTTQPSNGHINGTTEFTAKQTLLSELDANKDTTRPVQSPESPLPSVSHVDSKAYSSQEALIADIIKSMRLSGGCIIRNLVSAEALKQIEGEVRPYLDKAQPWNGGFGF